MLHVLLLILKIIGFLLLGILGLLLGLVLLVLLVPIRYRITGSYDEELEGTVKVTWLLHILSIVVSYQEDLLVTVRLFGFHLFRDKEESVTEEFDDGVEGEEDELDTILSIQETRPVDPILEQDDFEENLEPESIPTQEQPKTILEKIKFLFQSICAKLNAICDIKDKILDFIQNKENQDTIKLILRQLKALLRHVLPRKVKGSVTFGFEDPYRTGQVLSAASIFYAWYGKQIDITPVFDEAILEAEGTMVGRIRVGTLLVLGLRILINKNFRVLLKRWRNKGGVSNGR